jgi:GT2 family glycosyltransferase
MNFSVVIPTCDRPDFLRLCLDRLAPGRQTGAALQTADGAPGEGTTYEVIVTDDGGGEQAAALIAEHYPWARWKRGPRRGPASNRNHGASLARGEWLVFVDDDCLPDLELVSAYARARVGNPSAHVFEGRTYADCPRRTLAEFSPLNEAGGCLWSCNFAIEKSLFEALGGFDERFPYACMEDVDFRERLIARGERFSFLKEAAVCHPWRPRRIPQEFVQYERTLPIFLAAHPGKRGDLTAKYYFRVALQILLEEAIPSIWRYGGSGFSVGVRHHLFCLKMGLMVLFNRIPKYEEGSKR